MKADKNRADQSDYKQLRFKILFRMILTLILSVGVIYLIYGLFFEGRLAGSIIGFMEQFIFHDRDAALRAYQYVFRNNMDMIFLIAITIVFLLAFSFSLKNFTKYFSEINSGINSLVEEDHGEVVLSPELSATAKKIKQIKQALREREMAAQQAEQRKNDLVIYLAHDIRTPLTSVIGYLSLLDEASDMPPEQQAKYTHIALEKAYRLEKLVNEFFEITRYNFQQIEPQKETIDLYYMLVQLKDEFYPILSARGNTAILCADENLTVRGDPEKLARVFNNILKNAAAYSDLNTPIIISANEETDCVNITVQNRGPTIPAHKLTSIFEKFCRLDEARTSSTGGAGLGLAIAKEIVEAHHGTITAQSNDGITTFSVTLPTSD